MCRSVTRRDVPFKREYFQTEAGLTIKGRVAAIKHLLELGRAAEARDGLRRRLTHLTRDPHDMRDLLSCQLISGVTAGNEEE